MNFLVNKTQILHTEQQVQKSIHDFTIKKQEKITELVSFLDKNFNWIKYGISFDNIKKDIIVQYKNLSHLEYMNIEYLATSIYILYIVPDLNVLKRTKTDIFSSSEWKAIYANITKSVKTSEIDVQKEILIYILKIQTELF